MTTPNQIVVPVMLTVTAPTEEEARDFVDRLMRNGFESISHHEPLTWDAITSWKFGEAYPT